jgi:hypothetical protein
LLATILLGSALIYAALMMAYYLNTGLGQALSMVVAGLITGSFFAVIGWLIHHSEMNYMEKRNLLVTLNAILSIAIFWLAAAIGNGSIFRLHKIENSDAFSLLFGGGIFGILMGFGVLFDYALMSKTSIARLPLLLSLGLVSMMLFWYFLTNGLLFVVSVIIARIGVSVLTNRVLRNDVSQQVKTLGIYAVSLMLIVLPLTAYLSK